MEREPPTPSPQPPPQEPRVRRHRLRRVLAFLVAVASDTLALGFVLAPPIQWTVDVLTAVALFVLLGFRWPLLPVLVVEAIPGLAAFPTWVLVVGALVASDRRAPPSA